MSTTDADEIQMRMRAEAAAWLARLRSSDAGPEDHAGFRAWLSEDQRRADAFEQVTLAWEMVGAAVGQLDESHENRDREEGIDRRALVIAGSSLLVAVGVGVSYALTASQTYTTSTGEQRRIALADGTTVTLDTDTQIQVVLGHTQRLVKLVKGRTHFQVATDKLRPFVVRAGDQRVVALGTAFDISRLQDETAVLLVEGKVAVEAPQSGTSRTLMPGERLIFQKAQIIVQDRPDLFKVTAWQTGRIVFDDEPLSGAVLQMNRYSQRPLVIVGEALGARRISGIYEASDTEGFARSVSVLLSSSMRITSDAILLDASPPPSSQNHV